MPTPYNRQYARTPLPSDISGVNLYPTSIPEFTVVSVDPAPANQVPLVDGYSIIPTPTAGGPNPALGVTIQEAYGTSTSNSGQAEQAQAVPVATQGIVPVVLDGAVTAGQYVDASTINAGHVKAHTPGKPHLGQALMSGQDQDTIEILLGGGAPNA